MKLIVNLIEGALDADELDPEEVREALIDHCYLSIWYVLLLLQDGRERYAFFDLSHRTPFEPYTVFSPYTAQEMEMCYGSLQETTP